MRSKSRIISAALLAVFVIACYGCRAEASAPTGEFDAFIRGAARRTSLSPRGQQMAVEITAPASWKAEVEADGSWCALSGRASGRGARVLTFKVSPNLSRGNRKALIRVASSDGVIELEVVQRCTRYELPAVVRPEWMMEYPAGVFALEYSVEKKHPKWVAWPLHAGLLGDYTRSDAWQFDPRLDPYNITRADFQQQADLADPSRKITYDRGHLCPSNDRKASPEMNAQTFVYSNMSPQLPAFNQGIWAKLESCINKWASTFGDTLFICAGGTIFKEQDIASYTSPSGMAIPKYYFKVVLRKRGTDNYQAVGFWLENRDYGRKNEDFTSNVDNIVTTVDRIEELTGLDFFHDLPARIQDRVEAVVDSSAWNWLP